MFNFGELDAPDAGQRIGGIPTGEVVRQGVGEPLIAEQRAAGAGFAEILGALEQQHGVELAAWQPHPTDGRHEEFAGDGMMVGIGFAAERVAEPCTDARQTVPDEAGEIFAHRMEMAGVARGEHGIADGAVGELGAVAALQIGMDQDAIGILPGAWERPAGGDAAGRGRRTAQHGAIGEIVIGQAAGKMLIMQ